MLDIVLLKNLHVTLAISSVSLFLVRFIAREMAAACVNWRLFKVLPHVIDTLLLVSGVSLAILYRLSPLEAHWLLAKLVLLVGYIMLGLGAMKARDFAVRMLSALAAVCLVIGIMLLAVLKPF